MQAAVENQVGQGQGGETQVDALGGGLGGVTDKGAGPDGVLGEELQVVKFRVKSSGVQLQAVIQQLGLDAQFVVSDFSSLNSSSPNGLPGLLNPGDLAPVAADANTMVSAVTK